MADITNPLTPFLPDDIYHAFRRSFEFVDAAEELIEQFQRRYPGQKAILFDAFMTIQPGNLASYHIEIYRHHVRELLQRVISGQPLGPGTAAEVLVFLSTAGNIAPIHNTPAYLFYNLFRRMMGTNHPIVQDIEQVQLAEPYKGASAELERELREKLAQQRHKPDPARWERLQKANTA